MPGYLRLRRCFTTPSLGQATARAPTTRPQETASCLPARAAPQLAFPSSLWSPDVLTRPSRDARSRAVLLCGARRLLSAGEWLSLWSYYWQQTKIVKNANKKRHSHAVGAGPTELATVGRLCNGWVSAGGRVRPAMGIVAELRGSGHELVLTVRNEETGARMAIVEGSADYVERALLALRALPTPVRVLSENGDGWECALVSCKPPNRHAKRAS